MTPVEMMGELAPDVNLRSRPQPLEMRATGLKPRAGLKQALTGRVTELHTIGDCTQPGKIIDAVRERFCLACLIEAGHSQEASQIRPNPEMHLRTSEETEEETSEKVISFLEAHEYIPPKSECILCEYSEDDERALRQHLASLGFARKSADI